MRHLSVIRLAAIALSLTAPLAAFAAPIEIAAVKHEGPVDFEKEVLPIFRKACLACHNATEAEGKFVIETPQSILKGGSEGPAVVPGKSADSLLLKLAAHTKEPLMPPPDNDVKAKPLTPQELGLIKLWIDEGAKGQVVGAAGPIAWQPLPPGLNPVYAAAVSSDGRFAAAGRANQIFLYHLPSKRELGRLTDPALIKAGVYKNPGVAELDVVQSLRFSPDGRVLASGGFRTVKLWRRSDPAKAYDVAGLESAPRHISVSSDGKFAAIGEESGKIRIVDTATGQTAKTLAGHQAAVTSTAFSTDGNSLLSGSLDKTCRLWNLAESKEIGVLETASPLAVVAFGPEDKIVATGGEDKMLRTWNLPAPKVEGAEAPKPLKEMAHGGPITSIARLAEGKQLLTGCADGQVRLWDTAGGNNVKTMNHGSPVESVAATSDGKRVASGSAANNLKLFNGENGQMIAELKGDFRTGLRVGELTRVVSLSKRNVQLAQADLAEGQKRLKSEEENDKKAKEEIVKTETEFKAKTEAAKQPVAEKEAAEKVLAEATTAKTAAETAKKAADEAAVKAAEALAKVQPIRDAANNAATAAANELKQATDKATQAKDAAGKDAANAGLADAAKAAEKAMQDADAKNKAAVEAKAAADKQFADAEAAKKAADEMRQQAEKKFNDSMTAFNQADQKLKQVMPNAQKAVDELNTAERNFKAAQRSIERAAEAVKKATEAIPAAEAVVKKFEEAAKAADAELQAAQKVAQESEKPIRSLALSADGKTLATGGDDGMVHLWDMDTGAALETLPSQNAPLKAVAFIGDRVLAGAANNAATAWNVAVEWKLERTIGSPDDPMQLVDRVTAIDFSHDGKTLVAAGGEPSRSGEIKLFSVENGQLVRALKEPHSDTVLGVEFSPDDSQIASCGADRFMKVFKTADGAFVRSFEGHTHHVTGVSWRADGRLLATSGADAAVKVWDVRSGDQQRTIQGFNKEVTSLRFVADGDTAIVTTGANLVRLVNAANGGNVRDFPGSSDYVYCGAASADGKLFLAGGQDGVVRVWNEQGQLFVAFDPPKQPETTVAGK